MSLYNMDISVCIKLFRSSRSKMVNGFRYYRALESVSMIASALTTALTIYPCQIRVHQRWQSKLLLPTARKFTPMRLPVNTVIHTTLVGLEPATFQSLVRRATSIVPPSQPSDLINITSHFCTNCINTIILNFNCQCYFKHFPMSSKILIKMLGDKSLWLSIIGTVFNQIY